VARQFFILLHTILKKPVIRCPVARLEICSWSCGMKKYVKIKSYTKCCVVFKMTRGGFDRVCGGCCDFCCSIDAIFFIPAVMSKGHEKESNCRDGITLHQQCPKSCSSAATVGIPLRKRYNLFADLYSPSHLCNFSFILLVMVYSIL